MTRIISIYSLLIILAIITGACSTKNTIKSPTADELITFPPPPDTARIQFLTYIKSSADIVKPPSGLKKFFIGEEKPIPIIRPYGIESTKDRIYVCDPGMGGIDIINLKKNSFEYFIPTGKGQLQMPMNCFIDELKYLYVADGNRRQIVVFDSIGKYVHAFGEAKNFKPIDVCVMDDKVYVTNIEGQTYHVYDRKSFKLIHTNSDYSDGDEGYLYKPTSISINNNEIYITDFGEAEIKVFNIEGKFIRSIGSYGRGLGQFARPKEIGFDHQANLYVVDAAFENVQIFNNKGKLLTFFGRSGNMSLPAGISISHDNLDFFHPYVYEEFELKFLIYVTNQYPPTSIGVYGFIEEKVND